jgi:hypothetical protein
VDIHGYDGMYEINKKGEIWSNYKKGRIMKQKIDKYGYCSIQLYKDKKGHSHTVHRLVALTFIPNPNNLPEVNHKDTNKQNNHIDNLEWVTDSENKKHAYINGLLGKNIGAIGENNPMFKKGYLHAGEKSSCAKLTNAEAKIIREMYQTGKYTQIEIGKLFSVSEDVIYHIVNNHTYREAN